MEALILSATIAAAFAPIIVWAQLRQMAAARTEALMACKRATMRHDLSAFLERERSCAGALH